MSTQKINNQPAIVTGGTKGIGKALATAFAEEAAQVFIIGRNETAGDKIARLLSDIITFVKANVSEPTDGPIIINNTMQQTGRLDILINNAGTQYERTIEDTSPDEWDNVMNVNLKSVFLCSKYAIPIMRKQGGGKIINTASIDSYWAEPNLGAYSASKGGVLSLTKSIALDFASDGILCNCICPGYIATDMTEKYMQTTNNPEQTRQKLENNHPVGRMGTPKDIAATALWLAQDESNFITGQSITVDGGLTLGNIGFQ